MTNLGSILKSRDITLPTKVRLVKAMFFPVVMRVCESWTIKKTERRRIDAFELWHWRRLLRVPWIARRSNQSILKELSPEYSLEGLMLKLKLQYFGHLIWRTDSFEKTLMLGKIEGGSRRGWQRMRWLDGILTQRTWIWVSSKIGDGQGSLVCCSPWGHKELDTTEPLTELNLDTVLPPLLTINHNIWVFVSSLTSTSTFQTSDLIPLCSGSTVLHIRVWGSLVGAEKSSNFLVICNFSFWTFAWMKPQNPWIP